jgi:hypothetical protein
MTDCDQLARIVEDLIEVMHVQAKELEKLVEQVEQGAGRLASKPQMSVVASELSELHNRIKHLTAT